MIGLLLLVVATAAAGPRPAAPIHSLAVLPLQDLSPEPGQEYFADGITEELITNLAQRLPLRVISRTSVMRYKRTDKSIAQIAQELGVEAIVYELCLLGRYHWNKRTVAGLTKAEQYFREAIERDPTYAPAYAGLADAYALRPSYDSVSDKEYYEKAAAARHALELDDTLAEAHATLGLITLNGPIPVGT